MLTENPYNTDQDTLDHITSLGQYILDDIVEHAVIDLEILNDLQEVEEE